MIDNQRYIYIFLFFSLLFGRVSSQTLRLNVSCTDTIETVFLTDYWGDRYFVLDSAHRNERGQYEFRLPKAGYPTGLYSIRFGKEARFDLILNNEKNIEIDICPTQMLETVQVRNSVENEVYYQFIRENQQLEQAISAIDAAVLRYPEEERFYDTLVQKYDRLQQLRHQKIDQIVAWYPKSYVAKIVSMYRTPVLNARQTRRSQVETLRENFFYGLNFADEALMRSNVYPNKILELLQLYAEPDASPEEFEEAMKNAANRILSAASENATVFAFARDYLIAGFESFQLHNVLQFIEENWMQEQCNDNNTNRLEQRMTAFEQMEIGSKAPAFAVRNQAGNIKQLSEIETDYTFILFYAATCSHCTEVVGMLWDKYQHQQNQQFEVIAISIDQNQRAWEDFLDIHRFTWINTYSQQGFEGAVAASYNVFTTPMIFVLNADKQIVAKPMNKKELKVAFKTLGIK